LNDALAINKNTSSFIPHIPQQIQANSLGVPFKKYKSASSLIREGIEYGELFTSIHVCDTWSSS
jgi:hypothetical protein